MNLNLKYDIFKKGMINKAFFEEKYDIKKVSNKKYIVWLSCFILLSPKRIDKKNNKIKIVYTILQEKILNNHNDYSIVYTGQYLNSLKVLKQNNSIISYLNYLSRFKILVNSLKKGIELKIKLKVFPMWIEYCYLYEFINNNKLDEILIAGHFDRYATWISYICKNLNIKFKISQHGAIDFIDLPYKIHCDEFYVFNKYEADIVEHIILNREKCKIIEKGFKSSISFESINKVEDKKILIAIASQDALTNLTLELIEEIEFKFKDYNFELIIYPHYRESDDRYKEVIKKYNNIYIEKSKRYDNVDLLITFYSTIVYDYLDFDVQIMCLAPENINMSFFKHEKVSLYRSKENMYEDIKGMLMKSKDMKLISS